MRVRSLRATDDLAGIALHSDCSHFRPSLETGPQTLGPGQNATIDSDQQYAYLNDRPEPAVFMRVVTGA
ncbi:hypothetical protein AB0N99_07645 [Streptomyces sp. NPDC093272]|uniref:hypothetical protein n=1 Tax=Streptomyces sp. NPDC093272 TaxID=3154981 RepID=UPI0034366A42